MDKFKIMFVCHGNICRSPMAEFVFRDLLKHKNLSEYFFISSSAVSSEEISYGIGNPVYPPAKAELKKHGINCDFKRACLLKKSDYDEYDMIIGMDASNIRGINRIINADKDNKVYRLSDFSSDKSDISDPWYHGNFELTYREIYDGCTGLLSYIQTHFFNKN